MRDAIVFGYDWNGGTGPVERIALALARVGAKVLHCDSASSIFKKPDTSLRQIEPNLYTFKPRVFVSRLNRYPAMARMQGSAVARQILEHARALKLSNPIFAYGRLGSLVTPILAAMKARGCSLVSLYTDSFQAEEEVYVGRSDFTLVFSRTAFHRLRARWGEKILYSFFGVDLRPFRGLTWSPGQPPALLAGIPQPRLGYSGGHATEFLNTRVLHELLQRRPDWHFISFQWKPQALGMTPAVPLPNAHVLPWQDPAGLARCVAGFDVGFMPYDCSNVVLLNGPPMKLWDYFSLGMPVVSTPLIHVWDYQKENLVYLGETAGELEQAVEQALAEPADSPLRQRRIELTEQHSVERLGRSLEAILA